MERFLDLEKVAMVSRKGMRAREYTGSYQRCQALLLNYHGASLASSPNIPSSCETALKAIGIL